MLPVLREGLEQGTVYRERPDGGACAAGTPKLICCRTIEHRTIVNR